MINSNVNVKEGNKYNAIFSLDKYQIKFKSLQKDLCKMK